MWSVLVKFRFSQVYGQSRNQLNFVNIQKQRKNKRLVMSPYLRWLGSINPHTSKKMGSLYENSCAVHFSDEPHSKVGLNSHHSKLTMHSGLLIISRTSIISFLE